MQSLANIPTANSSLKSKLVVKIFFPKTNKTNNQTPCCKPTNFFWLGGLQNIFPQYNGQHGTVQFAFFIT
jgi:hypothetical protein